MRDITYTSVLGAWLQRSRTRQKPSSSVGAKLNNENCRWKSSTPNINGMRLGYVVTDVVNHVHAGIAANLPSTSLPRSASTSGSLCASCSGCTKPASGWPRSRAGSPLSNEEAIHNNDARHPGHVTLNHDFSARHCSTSLLLASRTSLPPPHTPTLPTIPTPTPVAARQRVACYPNARVLLYSPPRVPRFRAPGHARRSCVYLLT